MSEFKNQVDGDDIQRVTRLAPSPTGALHLGNARTFLINWAMAKQNDWRVVLRIEDLDGPRVKAGATELAIEDLQWLGMDWDEGPLYQRNELTPYHEALSELHGHGLIYPCGCSRREIMQAASAPQDGVHELRYSGKCRPKEISCGNTGEYSKSEYLDWPPTEVSSEIGEIAWRLCVPDDNVNFDDGYAGEQTVNVQQQVGDYVVSTKEGLPAYQLAVVVDDARQGVTDVVRGDDLIDSAGRQLWLYKFLGLTPLPQYYHLPLVIGEDGRRLAKRHGDTRVASYREAGVNVQRIIGLLGYWSGITDNRCEMDAAEFVARFTLDNLPKEKVVFTQEDDQWLMGEV